MIRRSPLARFLVASFAIVQFASPGVSAIADGRNAAAALAEQYAHVEESSSAKCPVAHPPDCAVCRYLSHGDALPVTRHAASAQVIRLAVQEPRSVTGSQSALSLPRGRAPPAA